jgi:hypothetical protein
MNLLSLKVLVLDINKRAFRSPVMSHGRPEYLWSADRKMIAECDKCNPGFSGTIGAECTCGLYSSPHLRAVEEYDGEEYAVLCLLNLYGTTDLWEGPLDHRLDLTDTIICRSWGARIIGIVDRTTLPRGYITDRRPIALPHLILASQIAADILNVDIFPWPIVKIMLNKTWANEPTYKEDK